MCPTTELLIYNFDKSRSLHALSYRLPFMSPHVHKAEIAKSEKCANSIAYCRLLQSCIYKNEPEQNFISLLL